MAFDFLPEHWCLIKSYAGIYHIRTDWDLSKLNNNTIQYILGWISPYDMSMNINNLSFHDRIKCIWKYLNKSKLYNLDYVLKNNCPHCNHDYIICDCIHN